MQACKFCGQTKRLAKAHIVPRSFYLSDNSGLPHMIMPMNGNLRSKKSRTGIYDEALNCVDCEKFFAKLDSYAFEHLIGRHSRRYVCRDADTGRYMVQDALPMAVYSPLAEREKLLAFASSVLWRASASDRPEMAGVNMGGDQEPIREGLRRGSLNDYQLAIARNTNRVWDGFVSVIGKWSDMGDALYRFDAGGFVFLLRNVNKKIERAMEPLFGSYLGCQVFILRSERESRFGRQLSFAARKSRANYGDPWKGMR